MLIGSTREWWVVSGRLSVVSCPLSVEKDGESQPRPEELRTTDHGPHTAYCSA
jgi:hypothetical protein